MDKIKIKEEYLLFLEKNNNFFLESISEEKYRYLYFDKNGTYHGEQTANDVLYDEIISYNLEPKEMHCVFVETINLYIKKYNILKYQGKINFQVDSHGYQCLCYDNVVLNKITRGDYLNNVSILVSQFRPINSFLFKHKIKIEELNSDFFLFRKHWYAVPEYREQWLLNQLEKVDKYAK